MGKASRRKKARREQEPIDTNITRRQFIRWGIGGAIALTGIGATCKFLYDLLKPVDFETACQTGRWQEYFDGILNTRRNELFLNNVDRICWDPGFKKLKEFGEVANRTYARNEDILPYYRKIEQAKTPDEHLAMVPIRSIPLENERYLIFVSETVLKVIENEDNVLSSLEHEGKHAEDKEFMEFEINFDIQIRKSEIANMETYKKGMKKELSAFLHIYSECAAYSIQLEHICEGKRKPSKKFVLSTLYNYKDYYNKLTEYRTSVVAQEAMKRLNNPKSPNEYRYNPKILNIIYANQ